MKKKLLALTLAALMALSLAACGGTSDTADTGDTGTESTESTDSSGTVYKIGICQLAPHVALDAATEGFIDAVTEGLGAENVDIDNQNAAGDSPTCGTIINGFVSAGVDLILANATAPLQTAAAATSTIPVLGTSVTEYGVALGIDGFTGTVGTNVSGTSDLAPLDEQAAMVKEWFPDAQTVGLLYCSPRPTASTRWTMFRPPWRSWATPAPSTPSPTPTTWPPSPSRPRTTAT